jgi:hypothetical protein
MKYVLIFLAGSVAMYLLLTYFAKKGKAGIKDKAGNKTSSTQELQKLLTTPESIAVAKTDEFSDLTKTDEFKSFVKTLTQEQIYAIAKNLTQ